MPWHLCPGTCAPAPVPHTQHVLECFMLLAWYVSCTPQILAVVSLCMTGTLATCNKEGCVSAAASPLSGSSFSTEHEA